VSGAQKGAGACGQATWLGFSACVRTWGKRLIALTRGAREAERERGHTGEGDWRRQTSPTGQREGQRARGGGN
jgi:hypothetical protein